MEVDCVHTLFLRRFFYERNLTLRIFGILELWKMEIPDPKLTSDFGTMQLYGIKADREFSLLWVLIKALGIPGLSGERILILEQ